MQRDKEDYIPDRVDIRERILVKNIQEYFAKKGMQCVYVTAGYYKNFTIGEYFRTKTADDARALLPDFKDNNRPDEFYLSFIQYGFDYEEDDEKEFTIGEMVVDFEKLKSKYDDVDDFDILLSLYCWLPWDENRTRRTFVLLPTAENFMNQKTWAYEDELFTRINKEEVEKIFGIPLDIIQKHHSILKVRNICFDVDEYLRWQYGG